MPADSKELVARYRDESVTRERPPRRSSTEGVQRQPHRLTIPNGAVSADAATALSE